MEWDILAVAGSTNLKSLKAQTDTGNMNNTKTTGKRRSFLALAEQVTPSTNILCFSHTVARDSRQRCLHRYSCPLSIYWSEYTLFSHSN
jgi:hypothetical protein